MKYYKGLKIKDNVDLSRLLDLGYKPKYDEDTGVIRYYYKYVYDTEWRGKGYCEYEIRIDNDLEIYSPTDYDNLHFTRFNKYEKIKRKLHYKTPEYNFVVNPLFFEIYELTMKDLLEEYYSKN